MTRATIGRAAVLLCVAAGFSVAAWSVGKTGLDSIVSVVLRLGVGGFAWYCVYSFGVFVVTGAAWAMAAGAPVQRIALFTWARLVREATADFLPFSQIGGLVIAGRVLSRRGLATSIVYASMIVDLTTEIASQLLFTVAGIAGLVMLLAEPSQLQPLMIPLGIGGTALAMIAAAIVSAPVGLRLAGRIAAWVGPRSLTAMTHIVDTLHELQQHRGRVAASFAFNLTAWVASAAGAYVVLQLMDVPLSLGRVLVLESLIFLLRSVAFAIPGGIGVQEFGYLVAGPIVGLPLEATLALALAKRARDLAIGVPTLLLWQILEVRAMIGQRIVRLNATRHIRR